MRAHHNLSTDQDANAAARAAAEGAVFGSIKWGIPLAAFGVIGYQVSLVYRGLTIPFKVFLQLSGMTLGGYIEADRRVRQFENSVRMQHRAERDYAIWQRWQSVLDDEAVSKAEEQKRNRLSGIESKRHS